MLFHAQHYIQLSVLPGVIHAPVFTLLRAAPVITIKQLLSLDIIKAHQNVEGGANPPVAQRPIAQEWSREVWFRVGHAER